MVKELSNPVVVDQGIAFWVRLGDGSKRIVVASKTRLGIGEDAQGLALLGAFVKASADLCTEVVGRIQAGTAEPVVYL